ncbi:NIPA-like protein 3 [Cladochytrium tenue]|nr:NIPA-like protein 3 [Cladochytrium tenue]
MLKGISDRLDSAFRLLYNMILNLLRIEVPSLQRGLGDDGDDVEEDEFGMSCKQDFGLEIAVNFQQRVAAPNQGRVRGRWLHGSYNPVDLSVYPSSKYGCCAGGESGQMCGSSLAGISTCDSSYMCFVSSNVSDNSSYCAGTDEKATEGIGVIICLIGDITRACSAANPVTAEEETVAAPMSDAGSVADGAPDPDGGGGDDSLRLTVPPQDKAEFQQSVDFMSLVRNPVWLLGFLVFVFSNVLNFVALQFAPQSLIGPLGSVSLVFNVVMAPLMNRERFTWKDVIGVQPNLALPDNLRRCRQVKRLAAARARKKAAAAAAAAVTAGRTDVAAAASGAPAASLDPVGEKRLAAVLVGQVVTG